MSKVVLSMERWIGKVAVVTGASAGIGYGLAERLVNEGLQVVGLARRSELIQELSNKLKGRQGKLYAIKADITKEEDILKAFDWITKNLGPIHILINNAGGLTQGLLLESTTESLKNTLDLNLLGLSVATREAVKIMRENNVDGHIIQMNSISGHYIPNVMGTNIYFATKHALTALTEILRRELNLLGTKIKVTSLSPGIVDTEIFEASHFTEEKELFTWKRLEVRDVADATVYILSTPPHVQVHELMIKPIGEEI